MPRRNRFTRISITLPRDLLAAADRRAQEMDRSRSWVIAEAIRTYGAGASESVAVTEGAADVAVARRRHLLAQLRLSPEDRLRQAAALVRLAPRQRAAPRAQLIGFDSYEDFYAWKKGRRAEGLPQT